MTKERLMRLREKINHINMEILELLSERGRLVNLVCEQKQQSGEPIFDPEREVAMLEDIVEANRGPFPDHVIRGVFKEIFKASVHYMETKTVEQMLVAKTADRPDKVIDVRGFEIGRDPFFIAGPCAVESDEQMDAVAARLASIGVPIMRGGAFKPRTSPYAFQGLGVEGLKMMHGAATRHGLRTVSEVTDTRLVELVAEFSDILQIGARNMFNYELLKEVGRSGKPVLLKRAFSATVDEFLQAAEYIVLAGSEDVILCERGIRTFSRRTRNTLDISVVPMLRRMSRLPVVVDPSHAAGRRDVLTDLTAAAFAAGAHGVMLEVHPNPAAARSDAQQQLSLDAFESLVGQVTAIMKNRLPRLENPALSAGVSKPEPRRSHEAVN